MPVTVQGTTLLLIGTVGDDSFYPVEDHFTYSEVLNALSRIGASRKVTIRINSGGGLATEGTAIASALMSHQGGCDVIVEGIAASAAADIVCAGQHVTMSLGSILMIHEASVVTIGTADDQKAAMVMLEAMNAAAASIYAKRSGKPVDEIRRIMADETWYTADQAVEAGFADVAAGARKAPVAYAYAKAYRDPPAALKSIQPQPRRVVTSAARQPSPPTTPAPKPVSAPAPIERARVAADPALVADMCLAAEQTGLAPSLIREGATIAQVEARLDILGQIRPMMKLVSGRSGISEELTAACLSGRMSVAQVREAIFANMAAADEALVVGNYKRTGDGAPDGRTVSRKSMADILKSKGIKPAR